MVIYPPLPCYVFFPMISHPRIPKVPSHGRTRHLSTTGPGSSATQLRTGAEGAERRQLDGEGEKITLGLVDLADFGETTWELNKYIYIYICIIDGLYSRLYLKFDYWRVQDSSNKDGDFLWDLKDMLMDLGKL